MELKEAIEVLSNNIVRIQILSDFADKEYCGQALQILLSLASSVIAIQGILPKKYSKEQIEEGSKQDLIIGASMNFTGGYNLALSEVAIALAKAKQEGKIIFNYVDNSK